MEKMELTPGDMIEITAKTALSMIPVGGTLVTCVWDSIRANAAQRRMDEWKALLEHRLQNLETTIEDIGSNERFATAIMKATDSALKTMEEEKREYLADAVLNSVDCELNESIMMMYFDYIDKYTLWHIRILNFFSNPQKFPGIVAEKYFMGSPMTPLCDVYPELGDRQDIVDKIIKDLHNDGLMNTGDIHGIMSGGGMVASRTTSLGSEFISFITAV